MRRLNAKPPALLGHLIMEKPVSKTRLFARLGGAKLAVFVTVAAAAAFLYLTACFFTVKNDLNFEIIIDGGSTGTRIHVFAFNFGELGGIELNLGATATMKQSPGLSAFADEPESAGEGLIGLLDFARRVVPRRQWGKTRVHLMATAGLRLLDQRIQDRILGSCRKALRASGFLFRSDWASVITGVDEGIYAWVAANYALGTLGGDPGETTGIIELGGASAQVTFVSNEPLPTEFVHVLRFGKVTYNLYSHSFLHFGQNAAHESFRLLLGSREKESGETPATVESLSDPCAPRGYTRGLESDNSQVFAIGNFSECRSAVQVLLQKREGDCVYTECRLGSSFVPPLRGKFIATENFFFTSKFFRLGRKPILSDFIAAGERFCGEKWMRIKRKYYSLDEDALSRYCFSSAYIVSLLHDGLGVALDDRRIMYTNKVGSVPLDWALGSFLLLAAAPDRIGDNGGYGGCSKLSVLAVAIALVAIVSLGASKWRKPQLRTIYDLERGRYFVTRVAPTRSVNIK